MKKKTYVLILSDTDRKRHEHLVGKGKVSGLVVQYETLIDNK